MDLNYFTYITGVASLLGFILQIFDIFPKHAGVRKSLFLFIFGIFIGTTLNALDASKIEISFKLSGYVLLVSVLLAVVIGFLVVGSMMEDSDRRVELFTISGVGTFAFFVILFFGFLLTAFSSDGVSPNAEKARLTTNELIELADAAKEKGDYDRELMHLETLQNRFLSDDVRYKKIEERITQEKSKQIK